MFVGVNSLDVGARDEGAHIADGNPALRPRTALECLLHTVLGAQDGAPSGVGFVVEGAGISHNQDRALAREKAAANLTGGVVEFANAPPVVVFGGNFHGRTAPNIDPVDWIAPARTQTQFDLVGTKR